MRKFISVLIGVILVMIVLLPVWAVSFGDTASHWAREDIDSLVGKGAVKGYTDGTFRPNNAITRAEFTAILLRALGNDVGNSPTGYWADKYVAEATSRGYIRQGDFDDVTKNISRGEIARMIVNALTDVPYPQNLSDYSGLIADYSGIPTVFQMPVLKAFTAGIMRGRPDGIFGCNETATRAEAVTMIVRCIDKGRRVIPELKPTTTPTPSINSGNERVEALRKVDGFSDISIDHNNYLILFSEPNEYNDNKDDSVINVLVAVDQNSRMAGTVKIFKKSDTSMAMLRKVIDIVYPGMSDEIYTLAAERIGGQGSSYINSNFHNAYFLGITHNSTPLIPIDKQGVNIVLNRKQ